ncbi:hypothetical protein DJ524_03260 [Sulfolobus sp. D5]|nr:hypothetical protein DJ523_06775 [Sulfolobus sp. E5]TRM81670.1 hypothetical protein DJ524_03260 [Sulfolobus sp. D5]
MSLLSLSPFSQTSKLYPYSLTVYHGKILVSYPAENTIYYYINDNLVPFLHIYDPLQILSNNFSIYIVSNGSLYYYNGSLYRLNITEPFMLFYDNYTNITYVTTYNDYVYELNGSTIVGKWYIIGSFGYMTFTNNSAIVDSELGYVFLYYNGSTHTTINCQDALSAMAFAGKYFISGTFDPIGIFVFHNLSVLKLDKIDDVYFNEIYDYNITFIPTNVVPEYIAYLNGVLYVASYQGLDAIDLINSQVFYHTNTPVYSMIVYNGSIYAATPNGILRYQLTLPRLYELRVQAEDLIYEGQQWGVIINGTKLESTNSTMNLLLAEGVYNITILSSWIEKPNVTNIILNLDSNYTLYVDYVRPYYYVHVYVNDTKGPVVLRVNNETMTYNYTNITLVLPAGVYNVSLSSPGYSVFPKSIIVELFSNVSLSFNLHQMITGSEITTLSTKSENNNVIMSSANIFNISILVLILLLALFFTVLYKLSKTRR